MTIYDWITAHPYNHLRIIRYIPNEDPSEEGESEVMFDSTTGEGNLSDLLLKEITNDCTYDEPDEDDVYELEYMPDEYYWW